MATQRFEFADGSAELVAFGSPRYWQLYLAGHRPAGEVPDADGISDALQAYLAGAFQAVVDAKATGVQRGVANGVAPLDGGALVPQGNLPAHLTPTALSASYVQFRDTNGNPISGHVVTITVDTSTGDIADITFA